MLQTSLHLLYLLGAGSITLSKETTQTTDFNNILRQRCHHFFSRIDYCLCLTSAQCESSDSRAAYRFSFKNVVYQRAGVTEKRWRSCSSVIWRAPFHALLWLDTCDLVLFISRSQPWRSRVLRMIFWIFESLRSGTVYVVPALVSTVDYWDWRGRFASSLSCSVVTCLWYSGGYVLIITPAGDALIRSDQTEVRARNSDRHLKALQPVDLFPRDIYSASIGSAVGRICAARCMGLSWPSIRVATSWKGLGEAVSYPTINLPGCGFHLENAWQVVRVLRGLWCRAMILATVKTMRPKWFEL